jgi:methylenetetrahydrofolate reductase (NADPH)
MSPRADKRIVAALRRARYEVIPLAGVEERVIAHVPRDLTVTVTASPPKGLESTLALTERLQGAGYATVPHLSARLLRSEGELKEIIDRLARAQVADVFIVGGDVDEPAGPFPDALSVLVFMEQHGHPFARLGITGYPESHPRIGDDVLIQAMWDKRRHAQYIVSQVCFRAEPIVGWIERIRRRGVDLPVHLGIPGITDRTKLLRIAGRIGVGETGRFLRHHKSWLWRLGLPGAYRPERLLEGVAATLERPESGVVGFHFYTFNDVEQTEAWRRAVIARGGPEQTGEET